MHVFRIDREKRHLNSMTGMGAYLNGGRWNRPGENVIYTAASRSLAILEMLVHFNLEKHLPHDRIMVEIVIPDGIDIRNYDPGENQDWRKFPYYFETQKIWSNHNDGDLMILEIPSAVVPEEKNYLINPLHPAFQMIEITEVSTLKLDRRLY